jgi:hypothetical protein
VSLISWILIFTSLVPIKSNHLFKAIRSILVNSIKVYTRYSLQSNNTIFFPNALTKYTPYHREILGPKFNCLKFKSIFCTVLSNLNLFSHQLVHYYNTVQVFQLILKVNIYTYTFEIFVSKSVVMKIVEFNITLVSSKKN